MRISWTKYVEPMAEIGDPAKVDESWVSPTGDTQLEELKTSLSDDGGSAAVYRGPVVSTRMGLMGTTLRALVARNCSMWVAVLDRYLTREMVAAVSAVPGVELLHPLSPYRFIVGFCPLFEVAACQAATEKALGIRPSRLVALGAAATATHPVFSLVAGPPAYAGGPATYEVVGGYSREEVAAGVATLAAAGWREVFAEQ